MSFGQSQAVPKLRLSLSLLLAACSPAKPSVEAVEAAAPAAPSDTSGVSVPSTATISFREGDFEGALEEARKSNKLLFVDGWAPWCHTCLSMRETVFPSPALSSYSSAYVFVEIDTDRPESTRFVGSHAMRVWPTFFVIDPRTREVIASYGGSMSVEETASFLGRGLSAAKDPGPGYAERGAAHRALLAGNADLAIEQYRKAISVLDSGHKREAVSGLLRAFSTKKDAGGCAMAGLEHADSVVGSSAQVDVLLHLLRCAGDAPADLKTRGEAFVSERLPKLVGSPPDGASIDDRSDAMGAWAGLLKKQGKDAEAIGVQRQRIAMLEAAAKSADSPEHQQVFDYERMLAYLAADRGEDALAMFRQRTTELPTSYEAFARYGYTLLELGRAEEALDPIERALELAYGPRRLRYFAMKSKALLKLGRTADAKAVLQQEVDAWKALPLGHFDQAKVDEAQTRLAALKD